MLHNFSRLIKDYVRHRFHETTVYMPVFLIICGIILNMIFQNGATRRTIAAEGDLGGPATSPSTDFREDAVLEDPSIPEYDSLPTADGDDEVGAIIIEDSSLLNNANPLSSVIVHRDGSTIYKVQSGDTLSKIAANFGVSLDTIYWANKGVRGHSLKLGQEIMILPVTGIIHEVQSGETLESIAALYEVSEARIIKYNKKVLSAGLSAGVNLIIPDARPTSNSQIASVSKLPDYPGYFAIPTTGWNWGKLHNYNAVDIANSCGTPIYASAEGLVVEAPSYGWNGGYGSYVLIEHPNGTRTKYAHNQKNIVSAGDYVSQGDVIAYIGNTGNTHGPTGCHLHFEVVGARNPFAK